MAFDLYQLISTSFGEFGDRPAMVAPEGRTVSYGRLTKTVEAFCAKANASGVTSGQRVLLSVPNPAVRIALVLALSRLGAIMVGGPGPAAALEARLPVDAIITDTLRSSLPVRQVLFDQSWAAGEERGEPVMPGLRDLDSTATELSSSGSTGKPKFMAFPLRLIKQRLDDHDAFHWIDTSRRLVSFGTATPFGLEIVLRTLRSGGLVAWPIDNPAATLQRVKEFELDELWIAPVLLPELIAAQNVSGIPRPALKRIVTSGGPLSRSVAQAAAKVFHCEIFNQYGSSELGPTAKIALHEGRPPDGSVGRVAPWIDVRTVDENGTTLPDGQDGELVLEASGARRVGPYLNAENSVAARFDGDAFRPGDRGYVDQSGELVISGRVTEVINTGGNKHSPDVFEEFCRTVPRVADVGAVALRNPAGYDGVGLVIVAETGFMEGLLQRRLKKQYEGKIQFRIAYAGELPRNVNGKLERWRLRDYFSRRQS